MRSVHLAAGAAVLIVMLAGCDGREPPVTPVPTLSVTPVFASDEEALAAAEESYKRYLAVSDQILQQSGSDPDRIDAVATSNVADDEKVGFKSFADHAYRSVGNTTFHNMQLEFYEPASQSGTDLIRVYVCTDSSNVDVVDSSGQSVLPANRQSEVAFEIGFDQLDRAKGPLVLSSKVVWEGGGVCEG